jgi:hypothetical protein
MSFRSPVYANIIHADESPRFGSVLDREDNITVMSECRWVDPTISSDDIASSPHNRVARDVCNKLVQIHLVSASKRHKAESIFAGAHDLHTRVVGWPASRGYWQMSSVRLDRRPRGGD